MPTDTAVNATVRISSRAAQQLGAGALWIFSNEVKDKTQIREAGQLCRFECQGRIVGTGYFNAHSLISGRVIEFAEAGNMAPLIARRLANALSRRPVPDASNSMRLVFSEADLLPGLVADWFSGALVLQSNTAGMDRLLPLASDLLVELLEKRGAVVSVVVHRCDSGIRALEGLTSFSSVIRGEEEKARDWFFQEGGLAISSDLLDGQKTGFFLDQKENRAFLEQWISGRPGSRTLDLFCYSGGWGLRALKAGGAFVEFVDQSGPALDLVKKSAGKNHFPSERLGTIESDAFEYLEKSSGLFDAVVADPPAFVKSKKNLPQAIKAYEKLVRLSWRKVKPGGLLVVSSCSYHVSDSDFVSLIRAAVGRESGLAHIVYRGRQGVDHPILLSMPETHYLKCIGLQKI